VIGATIIVVGLYSLIWGKSKDHHDGKQAGAAVAELPVSVAPPDVVNGNGKHVLGGHVIVADVEIPPSPVKCAH
jgi:hypothetical protein